MKDPMEVEINQRSMRRVANMLTLMRILVIPVIIWSFFIESTLFGQIMALSLFTAASITDYLDGKIARTFNATSKFGQMLDPIADKLLVGTVLIMLLITEQPNGLPRADLIPVLIIIMREIFVSGLREFMAHERMEMRVTDLAKWKTTIQLVAIIALLAAPLLPSYVDDIQNFGQVLLWTAAVLTIVTGVNYFRQALREIDDI